MRTKVGSPDGLIKRLTQKFPTLPGLSNSTLALQDFSSPCNASGSWSPKLQRMLVASPRVEALSEQSVNNLLPNTGYQQGLVRATGTKNPRVQTPALTC